MALITLDGTGTIASPQHLLLTCATVTDTLVLCEFSENTEPRELEREGWDRSDGRSLTGSVRVKGNLYPARRIWRLNFLVSNAQRNLFELMLAAQKNGQQCQLTDNFGTGGATNVFVDVDDRYLTPIGLDWHLLQFVAREDV